MSLIATIKPVTQYFGDQVIFKNISFSIEQNSRIGLVGKNGSGKTTLFKILTKRIISQEGEIQIAKNCKIAYLSQDPELDDEQSLYECVLESRLYFIELKQRLEKAEEELDRDESEKNIAIYSALQQRFEEIGGYEYETEIKLVLTSLDFQLKVWHQKVKLFSGGEKTRIQLAKFILSSFDLMLLDEPTNHLDLKMIYWLENYLRKNEKPYLIISHDRQFLNRTVTKIVEINNYGLITYRGNYDAFEKDKAQRELMREREFQNQEKKIKKMEEQIKQYRIWGRARDSEVMFKRAKELEKRLSKIDRIEKVKHSKKINLKINFDRRSGNDVFYLENVSFGFPANLLAKNINLRVNYKDKIAVLGENGCGKTTFLKLLNGKFPLLQGELKVGASLKIGYYDQMHINLEDNISVFDTIKKLSLAKTRGYVLSYLAKFGFRGDDVDKDVAILSGGEKARLYLAKLIHEKPNLLILDEPTNHLDIDMIKSLEESFLDYDGTIIFVSHDRCFINNVATEKWFFKDKTVIRTEETLENLFFKSETKISEKNTVKRKKTKSKKINPYIIEKMHTEILEIEKEIEAKKKIKKQLELKFTLPDTFSSEKKIKSLQDEIKEINLKISHLQKDLDEKEIDYLEKLENEEGKK